MCIYLCASASTCITGLHSLPVPFIHEHNLNLITLPNINYGHLHSLLQEKWRLWVAQYLGGSRSWSSEASRRRKDDSISASSEAKGQWQRSFGIQGFDTA